MEKYNDFEYMTVNDGRILSTFPNIGQMLFNSMDEFMVYVDGYHTTKDCFCKIETELRNAIEKHPKFCDVLSKLPKNEVHQSLKDLRFVNSYAPYKADAILMEEVYEALEAYQACDKKQCLKKLAQCGAVIIRMMEFVKKEMEGKAV